MPRELQPWNPFREMDRFRREFDDLFDRLLGGTTLEIEPASPFAPVVECFVENGKLTIRADLPGVDPKDVDVTVMGDMLTLRGKRQESHEERARNFFQREVRYGSFQRTIRLPEGLHADDIKASYKNGVLELTAELPREISGRKVPIQIEAESDRSK
jgi:HSP20 family protein